MKGIKKGRKEERKEGWKRGMEGGKKYTFIFLVLSCFSWKDDNKAVL